MATAPSGPFPRNRVPCAPHAPRSAASCTAGTSTDSLRYATGPIGVRLVRPVGLDDALLVEVSDPLPDPPHERVARDEDESGRGLQLVAGSSRRWGTRPGESGKTVWFELAVPG